ncbi:MAG: SLC13 family permease [Desulfurococcaceae archaeon]
MKLLNCARSLLLKVARFCLGNVLIRTVIIFVVLFLVSYAVIASTGVEQVGLGKHLVDFWCEKRGIDPGACSVRFNSGLTVVEQSLSLSLFLTVIVLTAVSMKLRYYAAVFALFILVLLGIAPPQELIMGVEWKLIVFLIGSMTLATILRSLGVFRFIALTVFRASRGSPFLFLVLLSVISWFLALAVDEATSIVYVMMLLLDIKKMTGKDITPLVILAVLATNTGSLAMPIGNPIGIYLAFTVGLHASDFVVYALPLSLVALLSLITVSYFALKSTLREIVDSITPEKTGIIVTEFYTRFEKRKWFPVVYGLTLLLGFLTAVSLARNIAEALQGIYGEYVDPHSLLAFIPYVFILLSLEEFKPEKLESVLLHGVEWPSLFFFIALFMLGHSLLWTGVAMRIAYLISKATIGLGSLLLGEVLLLATSVTSAFLDNLSVIVAFTPVAQSLVYSGLPHGLYWALLFGGVLGGNFTPIGSTANIVAVGICEKAKIRISWLNWLKLASVATLVQLLLACSWFALISG